MPEYVSHSDSEHLPALEAAQEIDTETEVDLESDALNETDWDKSTEDEISEATVPDDERTIPEEFEGAGGELPVLSDGGKDIQTELAGGCDCAKK